MQRFLRSQTFVELLHLNFKKSVRIDKLLDQRNRSVYIGLSRNLNFTIVRIHDSYTNELDSNITALVKVKPETSNIPEHVNF